MGLYIFIMAIALFSVFFIVKDKLAWLWISLFVLIVDTAIFYFVRELFHSSFQDGVIGILAITLLIVGSVMVILLPRRDGKSIFVNASNTTLA